MRKIKVLLSLTMMFIMTTGAMAQRHGIGDWERLGTVTASTTLDRDVIECANKGFFKALRFHVDGGRSIDLKAVYVQYGSGSVDKLDFDATIRPGGQSQVLDLRGDKRIIKRITIYYKTISKGGSKKSARLTVWGKH